jgi:nitrite reductase/ring-hydroxylating ferredoxin subunit
MVQLLLGAGFSASAVAFLYPAVKFMMPPAVAESTATEVVAGKVEEFTPNSARIFKFGNKPGILLLTAVGDWRAFSAVCPHLNCTVQFEAETHQIWCACHNARFDQNGNVISGPPPRGLDPFSVNIRGGEVVVSRQV